MKKKLISLVLAATMLICVMPGFAAETAAVEVQSSIDPFDNAYSVIVNAQSGRAITVNGMDNMALITVEDTDYAKNSQIWRLAPLGEEMFCYAVNKKSGRALDVPDAKKEDGVQLIQYSYNGNAQQKMKFEKSGDAYTISPSHADTYLAERDGKLVQTSDKAAANAKWKIVPVGESLMIAVKGSEGYKLLGEDQKRAFDSYFYSKLDLSRSVRNSAETLLASKNYYSLSPKEQKRLLTTALTYTAFGQVTGNVVNETPAEYEIVSVEQVPDFDIWRGSRTTCWIYQVEMKGDVEGQVHKFQFISNDEDKDAEMVTKAIEAIGVFPYALRQYVHNLYWKKGDTANSYNGGGNSIWIRLTWEPSRQQISQTLSHELGHVLEQNMLNDPDVWSLAERLDACPISSYGSSNETEDLAEFSRLYWTNLGKDTFGELEKVYPNRFKVFTGLLYRADSEYFKDYAENEKYIEELTEISRSAGSDSDNSKLDETKLYKIVDPLTDKVMTVKDSSVGNDVPLLMEQYTGKAGQHFRIEKYGNQIKLISANSNKPIQLDDSAMSGKSLAQYGGVWAIDERFAVYEEGGLIRLMAPRYQLYAANIGDNAGQTIEPFGWKFVEVGETDAVRRGVIKAENGLALSSGEAVDPVKAGNEGDTWKISLADEEGVYKIINTETDLSMDILDASAEEGAALITYDYYASGNQLFLIEEEKDGGFRLKNKNSGLYLTVNEDGSVTQQRKGDGQIFTLE